ncbi:MAG TPA: hypothetical protein VK166_01205, partial [Chitinophagaceae bacterium]|nr:hypothetical protein [Chitinophagaceae bacterium]
WKNFPWQEAIFHFTRLLGSVHIGDQTAAKFELETLNHLHDTLINKGETYTANQVAIQIKAGSAWIMMKEGKKPQALALMQTAADMESKTEKHPVTPGEVVPAEELLGDMLMVLGEPAMALKAYESNLQIHPNRFNAIYGAGMAAEKMGDMQKAPAYLQQLVNLAGNGPTERLEVNTSKQFLKKHANR